MIYNQLKLQEGRITSFSYDNAKSYNINEDFLEDLAEKGDLRYVWTWRAVENQEDSKGLRISFPIKWIPNVEPSKGNALINHKKVIYDAFTQALFYERINESSIIIDLKENDPGDNALKLKPSWQEEQFELRYLKDDDFEKDLTDRTRLEILEELLRHCRVGLPEEELKKAIYFDDDVIKDALNILMNVDKGNADVSLQNNKLVITDKGEKTRDEIKNKIDEKIKSKRKIGFK